MALAEDFRRLKMLSRSSCWKEEWDLEEKSFRQGNVVIVTDLLLKIIFASSNLLHMTGYRPEEVNGKTPGILQGKNTSAEIRAVIRKAIQELRPFHVSLLNYRKNGSPYHCGIEAFPVFIKKKKVAHFIAFEKIQDEF